MKITFFLLVLCLSIVTGCCNCRNSEKEVKKDRINSVKLSPGTQSFLMKLSDEKKNAPDITAYSPSEKLRNEFPIVLIKENYYVNGMLKTNSNIDTSTIDKLGVIVGTKAGNIWTVKIPLSKFEDLLNVSGIEYLQIDEKVHIK
ncbi:MAG: hypothetical protein ABSG15_07275 [FCB group bacterium]|jgi:hypothetical protein